HTAMTISTSCVGCHEHDGGTGGSVGRQHIDGTKYGGGNCDSCHGYQEASWSGATERAPEGKGAHAKHVKHLAALTSTTLDPATDSFGSGAPWTNVCGVCHNGSTHTMGESIPGNGREIAIGVSHQFGPSAPIYNGTPNVSSATDPKTCSNLDCHYKTTPVWQAY
ncbi:MAG: cytochrome c3 family protein, partial [Thermodesulfovibrionales bacterium]|nr:cytochrome c3 family protein [Thermodesulfovibrionales bacterium]